MSLRPYKLSIIGAGSYGTSLAVSTASKGLKVLLWGRNAKALESMRHDRCNDKYLPGVKFPESLHVASSLEEAVNSSDTILLVVPSHTFASVLTEIKPFLGKAHKIAWATKGLDGSGRLLSEVAVEILGAGYPLAALSGPTFAGELAKGLPTAIAVAANCNDFAGQLCRLLHTPTFRIYESSDLVALQLGGAVKNVIAIAAGLSDGLGYGANARTAVITRGLAEMIRFGCAMGATERGFMGLSGLGDLILTCTDNQSRNRRFGVMLGQGRAVNEALLSIGQVVEGYTMTPIMKSLSEKYHVQMPICCELYDVLYNGKPGSEAAASLLARSLKAE